MDRTAHYFSAAFELCRQPVGRDLAVCVRAGEPGRTAREHPFGTRAPGHTDVASFNREGVCSVALCDGGGAVGTAIQNHQNGDVMTCRRSVLGSSRGGLQASSQTPGLVVGRNDDADHTHVSSRSTTLGWLDQ